MDGRTLHDEEIAHMRTSVFYAETGVGVELLTGAVIWSDENSLELFATSDAFGGLAKEVFVYRTSPLIGEPLDELQYAWDEVRARCPEWIGFRPERTYAEHWRELIADALESM